MNGRRPHQRSSQDARTQHFPASPTRSTHTRVASNTCIHRQGRRVGERVRWPPRSTCTWASAGTSSGRAFGPWRQRRTVGTMGTTRPVARGVRGSTTVSYGRGRCRNVGGLCVCRMCFCRISHLMRALTHPPNTTAGGGTPFGRSSSPLFHAYDGKAAAVFVDSECKVLDRVRSVWRGYVLSIYVQQGSRSWQSSLP